MTNLIITGIIALIIATLLTYVEFPPAIQNLLNAFPIQFAMFDQIYLIQPVKWLIVLVITILLGGFIEAFIITLILMLNFETIQAFYRTTDIPTEIVPLTIRDRTTIKQPYITSPEIETDIDQVKQFQNTTLNAPPGGHQGASPVATSLLAIGQGDPSIGHWNPYINQ